MKVRWRDLTTEEQATYGNGCGLYATVLNVPDFIFRARCRQHDFYYERGTGSTNILGHIVFGIYYKVKADCEFFYWTFLDALESNKPVFYALVSVLYLIGTLFNPIAWWVFSYGQWRTKEEILERDAISKLKNK